MTGAYAKIGQLLSIVSVLRLETLIRIVAACALIATSVAFMPAFARDGLPPKSPGTFETKAKHAILMDADANLVLYEKDADTLMPPASMSKLMTLAVVFRELKAGRLRLDDQFKVSEHAWRTGGAPSGSSAMFAPLNSMVSIEDLIQGITVQSGNDACIVLAEGISGTEEAFAKQMNDYAKEIGLARSHFVNSTGLPADGHVMTARELAMLAHYLIVTYPDYYHYFGQKDFKFNKHTYTNRNPLIFSDLGVDGLKTGYIDGRGLRPRGERQARRPASDHRRQRAGIEEGARGGAAQADRVGVQEFQAVPVVRPG